MGHALSIKLEGLLCDNSQTGGGDFAAARFLYARDRSQKPTDLLNRMQVGRRIMSIDLSREHGNETAAIRVAEIG